MSFKSIKKEVVFHSVFFSFKNIFKKEFVFSIAFNEYFLQDVCFSWVFFLLILMVLL